MKQSKLLYYFCKAWTFLLVHFKIMVIVVSCKYFACTVSQHVVEGTIFTTDLSSLSSNSTECKPIMECRTYLWLLHQTNGTENVLQDLVSRVCGISGTSPMIECPVENKLVLHTPDGNANTERKWAIYNLAQKGCFGSLIILHYGDSGLPFKRMKLTEYNYRELSVLSERVVIKIDVRGDCCWKLFENPSFDGQLQTVEPGYKQPPDFQPKSIKKIEC